jgi:parallel beta-helix repeat protein
LGYHDGSNLITKNLTLSAVSGKIHIINNSGWVDFRNAGNCTGNGTFTNPYIIEDLVIDGGGLGSCILVENSTVFFKIENCTVYNSGVSLNAGIKLSYVNNSQLINNNCTSNYRGILLSNSDNNSILGIDANFNDRGGIHLIRSNNNTVSGNIANYNTYGINLDNSNNNTISGNTINSNNVFGIVLSGSNSNIISGNTANNNIDTGISLFFSNYNTISGNTAINNRYGIYLYDSNSNTISRNILVGNNICIYEDETSNSNVYKNNECGEIFSEFNIIILFGILTILVIFLIATLITGKKRVCLLFSGTIGLFNIYAFFNTINSFRRDYNRSLSIFPIYNYIIILLLFNAIFILIALLLVKYLDEFKGNRIIQKVQAFFNIARNNIFKIEKKTDMIISLILLFCVFYMVGFLSVFIHEFGHALMTIIFDGYYHSIFINIYLQGGSFSVIVIQPSDPLFVVKYTVYLLGGLIAESAFALISLIILLKKKEMNKFGWLLSIAIIMLFFDRVTLYFTFPQFFNISSDTLSMVNILNYNPWVLFFIFLPFLLVAFYFTYRIMSMFYEITLNRDKRFIGVYFLGLAIYIVVLVVLGVIDRYLISFIPITFY